MRLLFISVYYRPDGGPAAPLFTMLSEALVQRGHSVTVLTTVPHYPSGSVPASFRGWSIRTTMENGVRVIRLPLPSLDRKSLSARLLQFLIYQFLATIYSLRLSFDVLLSHSSALEVWLPFMVNVIIRRKPAVYSVHDIYPDVGIKLGIFRGKFTIGLVTWLEKNCLSHATKVRILSDSFTERIQSLGVPKSKIALIHDWVEVDKKGRLPRCNSFSSEYNLNDTLNVVYAGNMGVVQGLETVLESATLLQQEKQVRFVFVGDGAAKPDLVEKTKQHELSNVVFIPYQARDKMPEVWASADIALIVLRKGTGTGALPSKTFSIMASGRPILASVDEDCETRRLVREAEAGMCVPPGDASKLAEAVICLKQDRNLRKRQGCNGRIWVEQHHSPQFAAEEFEKLLVEASTSQKS